MLDLFLFRLITHHFNYANVWVGLEKRAPDHINWIWVDDEIESKNSSRWDEGEPNNFNQMQYCVELLGKNARLNDARCLATRRALCERRRLNN